MTSSTTTVINPTLPQCSHDDLLQAFKGKHLSNIQTPHLVIDSGIFIKNCERMKDAVARLGWDFRAHIKTHKTAEGTRLQCQKTGTKRIIVSTLPEAWTVINAGLIADGTVTDMLYSMPPTMKLLQPLRQIKAALDKYGATFRLMIDNPAQIKGLEAGLKAAGEQDQVWSIYLKLDIGSKRAGLPPTSDSMADLIRAALSSSNVSVFGTYTHANFSYASKTAMRATEILAQEVASTNESAKLVLSIADELGASVSAQVKKHGLRLAVGATPTAHAAGPEWEAERKKAGVAAGDLVGSVELHAGCYCLLDAQQCATSLVDFDACAMFVGSTIISTYPDRGEALCDAGAICMSKDVGPVPGYGPVVAPHSMQGWHLNRTSQEHGILGKEEGKQQTGEPEIEQYVTIVPQHACLTAAQHPWYLIVDGSDVVQDVWVPCRGW